MQGPIERRHGPVVAILVTGILFGLVHFTHPEVTLILMPYYLGAAAIYGALAYLTDSILPSAALHAAGNVFSIIALFAGGRAEWQASATPAPLIWQTGADASFWFSCVAALAVGAAVWTLLALVGGVALLGLYTVALRARIGRPAEGAFNLLEIPWLRRLLTSPALQPSLQIPLLLLMGIVVFLGFADVQDGGQNLATKLTWTIWWAGIIFTFFLVGRVWCLACPFGALNEWTSRLAAPLRRETRSPPSSGATCTRFWQAWTCRARTSGRLRARWLGGTG
jgi:hypothetical protein